MFQFLSHAWPIIAGAAGAVATITPVLLHLLNLKRQNKEMVLKVRESELREKEWRQKDSEAAARLQQLRLTNESLSAEADGRRARIVKPTESEISKAIHGLYGGKAALALMLVIGGMEEGVPTFATSIEKLVNHEVDKQSAAREYTHDRFVGKVLGNVFADAPRNIISIGTEYSTDLRIYNPKTQKFLDKERILVEQGIELDDPLEIRGFIVRLDGKYGTGEE